MSGNREIGFKFAHKITDEFNGFSTSDCQVYTVIFDLSRMGLISELNMVGVGHTLRILWQ
jgi:hypothetical protein